MNFNILNHIGKRAVEQCTNARSHKCYSPPAEVSVSLHRGSSTSEEVCPSENRQNKRMANIFVRILLAKISILGTVVE